MLEVILEQIAIDLFIAAARSFLRRTVAEAPRPIGPRSDRISRLTMLRPTIVSAIPGRVRFRVSALRGDSSLAHELCVHMSRLPGIRFVEANATTGSFLARYEPDEVDIAAITKTIAAWTLGLAVGPFGTNLPSRRSRYGHAVVGRTRRRPARAVAGRA